jgi:hypothetical protein
MSYAYSYETNSVSKWDTIQEDVADAYTYLEEDVVEEEDSELSSLDALSIDDLSDADLLTLDWNN